MMIQRLTLLACLACADTAVPHSEPEPRANAWTVEATVSPGTTLTESMLVPIEASWIADEEPPGRDSFVGRTPRHARLLPGEPIRDKRLSIPGRGDLPGLIDNGMRAVTVPASSVSGMRPGIYADLYVGRGEEALFMQGVRVLAVHPSAAKGGPGTVTVQVTSLQAADLVGVEFASLALRNPVDVTSVVTHGKLVVPAPSGDGPVKVMVAARDLYPGVSITAEDLVEIGVTDPPKNLPENAIGRIPFERILAGEPIRTERLADPKTGHGVEAVIPRGCRSVWLAVDGAQVQSLKPANYVDVLARVPGEPPRALAQASFVLGVMTSPAGTAAEANLLLCDTREIQDVLESRHVPGVRYSLGLRADMDEGLADYGKDGSSIVLTRP